MIQVKELFPSDFRFKFQRMANPAVPPSVYLVTLTLSDDAKYLGAFGNWDGSSFFMYKKSGATYTKLTSGLPAVGASTGHAAWSRDSNYFATDGSARRIWKRNANDTFTLLMNSGSAVTGVAISSDGLHFAFSAAVTTSGNLMVYKRTGDAFAELSISQKPTDRLVYSIAMSPDGSHLAVGGGDDNYNAWVFVYKRNGDVYTRILTALPGLSWGSLIVTHLWYTPDSQQLIVKGNSNTAPPTRFKRNGDSYANLGSIHGSTFITNDITCSPDDKYILLIGQYTFQAPLISTKLFERSGDSLIEKTDSPLLMTNVRGGAFSPISSPGKPYHLIMSRYDFPNDYFMQYT